MNKTVRRTLVEKCSVEKGEKIIVALSGGADSVTLLDVLLEISYEMNLEIMAAHVNHNLRGDESVRDEEFVRNLCREKGVKLFVTGQDVAALAKEKGESIELCGRKVRYDFFGKLAKEHGAKIATAHTLSDCEETMLYNIARGTSLHGLCSIPYKRDEIIRPLLDVSREQIEQYCKERELPFVQDSTNFDEDVCKRNKIRLSVLPPLKSLTDGFHQSFQRLREDLQYADDFMRITALQALSQCRCPFGYNADELLKLHRGVLDYALVLAIADSGAKAENRHIALCRNILSKSGAVMLPGAYVALCSQGVFRIISPDNKQEKFQLPLVAPMDFCFREEEFSASLLPIEEIVYKKLASLCIDCDKIQGAVIRTRQEGDTFTLPRRGVTKPLRKLQNELKIPSELRSNSLVAAQGNIILWAQYIGVSAQGAVSENTKEGIFIYKKDVGNNA